MPLHTPPLLTTIGYEGASQAEVIAALKQAGVATLIDIRAVAASRRAGFSKTALKNGLNENGINYVHLRGLGTPKAGRDAARAGRTSVMHEIFNQHMQSPEAQAELAMALDLTQGRPCCLLCFEHDHSGCHRLLVAQALQKRAPFQCVHLRPSMIIT